MSTNPIQYTKLGGNLANQLAPYDTNQNGGSYLVLDKTELENLRKLDKGLYDKVMKASDGITAQQRKKILQNGSYSYGVAANHFTINSLMPGATVHAKMWGTGYTFDGYESKTAVRLGITGFFATKANNNTDRFMYAIHGNAGVGIQRDNGFNYMVIANVDHDSDEHNDSHYQVTSAVFGGELGHKIVFGKNSIFQAGIHTGIGIIGGFNGRILNTDGESVRHKIQDRRVLVAGVAFDTRIGKAGEVGTVKADGTYQLFTDGVGFRTNTNLGVYIDENLLIGGGVRTFFFSDPSHPASQEISRFTPYVSITLVGK